MISLLFFLKSKKEAHGLLTAHSSLRPLRLGVIKFTEKFFSVVLLCKEPRSLFPDPQAPYFCISTFPAAETFTPSERRRPICTSLPSPSLRAIVPLARITLCQGRFNFAESECSTLTVCRAPLRSPAARATSLYDETLPLGIALMAWTI